MFKQLKSAMIWYYLFKFRRRIILIFFLLLIALFSNSIYADIVEYLRLKNKLEYLELALILKWLIIIFNILYSIYCFLTIFKKEPQKKESSKEKVAKKDKFTKREEYFLNKKNLNSKADLLLKR